jgi:hypothetical protein
MMKKLTAALLLAGAGLAHANDDLTLSGFATITAGKAYSGYSGTFNEFQCPCFIGNYEHGATYEKNQWSLAKESLVGVQARYKFNDQLSATVQGVARASGSAGPKFDWAYLSYDLSPDTTVQVGRRRLPIYAYSDSVYIGYTLPWVRVPQDIYGWEVGAYNGANVTHRMSVGNWAVAGNLFAGQENTKSNREMEKIYYPGYRVDDAWKHILGGYLDVSNDIFGARAMYMQNSIDQVFFPDDIAASRGVRQRIIGLSASLDYNNFLVRAEANSFVRPSLDYKSTSWTTTVGYKIGDFTPVIGYSHYTEKLTDTYTLPQIDNTRFVALRWDFRKNMDLKIQFDSVVDHSAYNFTNNAKMISAALDVVF